MNSGTVLVVDDEVLFARSQADLLRRQGFEAFVAHCAREAREAVAAHAPEVVLTDLQLPDADGAELMVELKAEYPHVQFIIITAHGSIRSAVESTKSGAVDYLTKPLEPDAVLLAVRKANAAVALPFALSSSSESFAAISAIKRPMLPAEPGATTQAATA